MTSTRRRSGRQIKYKEESSDDEEEDPKVASAKSKLKQLMNEDSDGESDFEQEVIKKGKAQSSSSEEEENGEENIEEDDLEPVKKIMAAKKNTMFQNYTKNSNGGGVKQNLNLSDSESSSDEESKQERSKKNMTLGVPRTQMRVSSFESEGGHSTEDNQEQDDMMSSQTLIALAQNLNQISSTWKDSGAPPLLQDAMKEEVPDIKPDISTLSAAKTPKERKGKASKKSAKDSSEKSAKSSLNDTNLDSISKLLAKGEKIKEEDGYGSEEEEGDLVNGVKTEEAGASSVPKEGIEVTISLPDKARKKKKQFDVAAFLKRELSKARHETQKLMHQSHYVCLVAHLRYLNSLLVDPTLLGLALSVIPKAHSQKPKTFTLTTLASTLRWFCEFMTVNKFENMTSQLSIRSRLSKVFESYVVMDNMEHVCSFVLMCRAIGLDCRLVLNLDVVPVKPPNDDSRKSSGKDKVKKESPPPPEPAKAKKGGKEATKRKLKGSDSEGDEQDYEKSKDKKSLSSKLAEKKSSSSAKDSKTTPAKDSKSSAKESKFSAKESKFSAKESKSSANYSKLSAKDDRRKSEPRGNSRSSSRAADKRRSEPPPPAVKAESINGRSKRKSAEGGESSGRPKRRASRAILEIDYIKAKEEKEDNKRKSRGTMKEEESSDEDFEPCPSPPPSTSRSNSSKKKKNEEEKSKKRKSSGDDFEPSPPSTSRSKSANSTKPATNKKPVPDRTLNYWVEVYLEKDKKWICFDVKTGKMNTPADIEARLPKPIFYILAVDTKGYFKDVTRRYASDYITSTRKLRYDEDWIEETLKKFTQRSGNKSKQEDQELERKSEEAPMPTTVSGFKNHPLYVLKRHLLKFEAIYPAEAPPLGWWKSEPVYARECVHTLQGRTSWLKEGRTVKVGEEAYKVVTARPKYDRMTGTMVKDQPLDVFGHWQTEKYIPPPAKDGKVPRNEYGNVELFKPWMLPKGTVHIPINGLTRVLRKLNVDAAPAMMGWDFSGGGCHPVFDGYVVCKEFEDLVIDAWDQDQREREERAEEKREKRILDNWRRLVKGLFIREKIQAKYMKKK